MGSHCYNGKSTRKGKKKYWVSSFKNVNLHPDFRISFLEWSKKIEKDLETGERFFVARNGLFDALPTFWQHMTCEARHEVVAVLWIDSTKKQN